MILSSSEHNHIYPFFFTQKKLQHKPHKLAWALLTEDPKLEANGTSQIRKTRGPSRDIRKEGEKIEAALDFFHKYLGL